ncbi:diguanylate cyclase/phosphodiesterase (GGDEF & EAL domains) with PAS/PAC sensor(s) [plant metagenome]|uniref:Diguanylate cyclase/phosphodiesterase (GGDEF & EAL domains) with PAS/PAC sensor(S) n=1 Tax=plant metagenome TaxID=1297885 RepID=A0A484P0L3_9ZZZZ
MVLSPGASLFIAAVPPRPANPPAQPMLSRLFQIDLQRLILWLCLLSVVVALGNALYASYLVQREVLLRNTLEANRMYASKLAQVTNNLLQDAQHLLSYSTESLDGQLVAGPRLEAEADRLQQQSQHFDSVVFMRFDGMVLATSPSSIGLAGKLLESDVSRYIRKLQLPYISEPFKGSTGRWLISLSYPIFDDDDLYLGAVIGSIYLHERNVLSRLLGQHYYRDGSHLFVVDGKGIVLYHPDRRRIGLPAGNDTIIRSAMSGQEGDGQLRDADGVDMLAGYAWVNTANWGVVAQRPTATTLARLDELLWVTVRNALPLLLLLLPGIWWMSKLIAQPLRRLASIARRMDDGASADEIKQVPSWYFEAQQLKRALQAGLDSVHRIMQGLRRENATDPLTGLTNRRGLTTVLREYLHNDSRYAVLALDIDHFKQVNDTYGHDVGDTLLVHLASILQQNSREADLACRSGGEEFMMVLLHATLAEAQVAAQRLHDQLRLQPNPIGQPITISIGIAHYPETTSRPEDLLKQADQALYAAKRGGRNRTCLAEPDNKDLPADRPEA